MYGTATIIFLFQPCWYCWETFCRLNASERIKGTLLCLSYSSSFSLDSQWKSTKVPIKLPMKFNELYKEKFFISVQLIISYLRRNGFNALFARKSTYSNKNLSLNFNKNFTSGHLKITCDIKHLLIHHFQKNTWSYVLHMKSVHPFNVHVRSENKMPYNARPCGSPSIS